jgi:hypothetical protein
VAFKLYPRRAILGFALFVGQAFIYNGVTFNLGTLFTTFFGVAAGVVPVFIIIYGIGNFLGPLTLGRLFDTVGRKPMIAGCYLGSALLTVPMGILFQQDLIGEWTFEAFVFVTFFLASAGASAAYLTVSEIFPMETRALAIAFFYAIGTAAGGIAGPLLFGHLIETGDRTNVMIAFFIGAGVMAIGGIAELFLGVRSEQAQLEDIAQPLTVEDAEQEDAERKDDGDDDEDAERRRAEAERQRRRHELEARVRTRIARRRALERQGLRRYRPGPPERAAAAWLATTSVDVSDDLDREIEIIGRALDEHGPTERRALSRLVGARYWGPGRFRAALREAVADGRARRLSRSAYGPPPPDDDNRS